MKTNTLSLTLLLSFSLITLVGFGGSITSAKQQDSNQALTSDATVQQDSVTLISPAKSLIDFSLTDTNNKIFNKNSLLGHWTVLFFGYSDCPEICPRALATISEVWRSFPNHTPHPKAQFVVVSLNSESDSTTKLKEFLKKFNPSFIGVRGKEEDINKLTNACGIYQWTDSKLDAKGNKIIDHSATLLLINPEAQMIALFSPPHSPEFIAKELAKLMQP